MATSASTIKLKADKISKTLQTQKSKTKQLNDVLYFIAELFPFHACWSEYDIQQEMVYYQPTPLMIKTEKFSQAQFCSPLRKSSVSNNNATASKHMQQLRHIQLGTSHSYHINANSADVMQQQSHSKQTNISNKLNITAVSSQLNKTTEQNFLTNIKKELPSDIPTICDSSKSSFDSASSLPTVPSSIAMVMNSNNNATLTAAAADVPTTPPSTDPTVTFCRKLTINKPQFKCQQCGIAFGSKCAHTSHAKSHIKSGANVALTLVTEPVETVHGDDDVPMDLPKSLNASGIVGGDPYKCNVCHKTFAVPARLIRHYRTHTGERPFECEFCHKLFSVKENLQVHRRIHTKERPYKCDVCGRAFEHSGKLHRHMRIHTGERPHKCSVCEKTFIQSGQLVIHMRTHTGEKPYKCPVEGCGKGFTCSKQLKVHSRTHTGEKPYHCDICFRDFGYNHVLKLHRVQHYGSKCYKCTICDETFKSKKEMEAHIKGHANEIPDDDVDTVMQSADVLTSSASNSSSRDMPSRPQSPQSPHISVTPVAKTRKSNNKRTRVSATKISVDLLKSPSLSAASDTEKSAATTPLLITHSISLKNKSEYIYRDNNDTGNDKVNNKSQLPSVIPTASNSHDQSICVIKALPTDLNKQLKSTATKYNEQKHTQIVQEQQLQTQYSYWSHNPSTIKQQQISSQPPTINPALLEAASIASSRVMDSLHGEEVKQAALQILQLRRTQQYSQHKLIPSHSQTEFASIAEETLNSSSLSSSPSKLSSSQYILFGKDLTQYDDTKEASEFIEDYRRGELAHHGLQKGSAPVPKFESSLLNNEIIVRQVEAAIAPLRSSTESPERSSSPESDSMLMMADRDVMTLPLRKRKIYMHKGSQSEASSGNNAVHEMDAPSSLGLSVTTDHEDTTSSVRTGNELDTRVIRINSVIQFAKAS